MDKLFEKSIQKFRKVPTAFKRYLLDRVEWDNRLIGIKGARGAGKTTLLLQYAKDQLPIDKQTLYVSLDDLYFTENKLVDLADNFVKRGGRYLLLDEVHRYGNWSQELKNIYDDQPDLYVVFTGSSMMHLNKASGDLSRRAVMYELNGLSFREFLNFSLKTDYKPVGFDELINSHTGIAADIVDSLRPLAYFNDYLKYGYYPYFKESVGLYPQKLAETISLALNIDLPSTADITFGSIEKIRLLLHIIAESVPFKPNITKLSERTGIGRNNLIQYIRYLEDLRIVRGLYPDVKGIGLLQKPEKLFLHHPNLQYALSEDVVNIGNVRESFFINQLSSIGKLSYTKDGDFALGNYIFEIGGKKKTNKQVKHLENSFVVTDDVEIGIDHKLPLWLFGFLY
ncbi:ATP-binding protein [Plebeiibacterium marinum]|uniref:AAA family ATPase n=1 Tax=Plebeiibacterium marinum TaxID=2992111 RepID=A0AAE3MJ68_9BACT|nr:AAA family ATPase [Plebeiobacterium marinum]MCW3808037.1 AAA family ATPase [Plebeiobacterium marinum]